MTDWAPAFSYGLGGLHRLGDVGLGGGDGFGWGVAEDEPRKQSGGKGAAGSVGGAGFDELAGEPAFGSLLGAEVVVGWIEMASGDDEVEAGIVGGEAGGGQGNGFPVGNGGFGQAGQFGEVGGEPAYAGQQVLLEAGEPLF